MPIKIRSALLAILAVTLVSLAAFQNPTDEPSKERLAALKSDAPQYWKGNLHTHSLWSDGNDFPEMIADWYKRHDYDFLALTDHNVLSEGQRWIDSGRHSVAMKKYLTRFGEQWVEQRQTNGRKQVRLKPLAEFRSVLEEPGKFLLVPGEEITHRFARYPVHMNAINLRNVIQPVDGDSVAETIRVNHRQVLDQQKRTTRNILTFLNHPNFRWGVKAEDMIPVEELQFFEIYNGHPGVANYGDKLHPGCERMWDILLAQRLGKHRLPIVYGVATDDAHRYHVFGVGKVNPGRGWVMVKAPHLTSETIVQAMKSGDFYCSTGVSFESINKENGKLSLKIAGEKGVSYETEIIATMKDAPLTSKPRVDDKGKPLDVTRIYSDQIGKVIQKINGTDVSYKFTGKEIYVRAKVISTKVHPNPFQKGDVEVAWTQPFLP